MFPKRTKIGVICSSAALGAAFVTGCFFATGAFGAGTAGASAPQDCILQADCGFSHGPVGVWNVQVTPQGVPIAPFTSTLAYAPGGIVIEATSKPHQTPAGALSDSTEGLGVWSDSWDNGLTIDFHKYNFDANGNYTGETTIHESDTLASDDNSYAGTAQVTVTNPAGGTIIQFSATSSATRMSS